MNKRFFYQSMISGLVAALFFTSCSGGDEPEIDPEEWTGAEYIYVLNSGKMNSNNASLSGYNPEDGTVLKDVFLARNGRRLGDTGQDIVVYGSKMYIAVYTESTIEVTDLDANSIKQIRTEGQPRHMAVDGGKVYVTYSNGYVARLDTGSLEVEARVRVGRNPEKLVVVADRLYVANSGGFDHNTPGVGYDNTVSVVDVASFSEVKKIEVVINPCEVTYDKMGNVYVVSMGDYGAVPNTLQRINTVSDEVSVVEDFNGTYLAVAGEVLYTIFSQYDANWNQIISYYSYDMIGDRVLSDRFVGDTGIEKPYAMNYDEAGESLFITTSDYTNDGDVFVFDKANNYVGRFEAGLNPIKVVHVKK